MIVYLDTSAALKLLVDEVESDLLVDWLGALGESDHLVSSFLLCTELYCAASRRVQFDSDSVERLLAGVSLVRLEEEHLVLAARAGWGLRAGDAIHLATAQLLAVDVLVAYDRELIAAGRAAGLPTLSPGRG